jgi:hypothetical protein
MLNRFLVLALCLTASAPSMANNIPQQTSSSPLPYRAAGLTDREAAVHLLSRFAYGPRPGDVDRLLAVGLDRWVEQQLHGRKF